VAETGQPYAYTGDDPLNATDPLGLCWSPIGCGALKRATHDIRKVAHKAVHVADVVRHTTAHLANNAATEVKSHWRGELQIVGTVAAVASAATGVGALADVGVLGLDASTTATVSTVTGLVSSAADLPTCISGDRASCAGAALGGVAGIGSGISSVLDEGLLSGLVGAKAFGLGLGGLAWDASNDAGN
jgi:hypothetical protein